MNKLSFPTNGGKIIIFSLKGKQIEAESEQHK